MRESEIEALANGVKIVNFRAKANGTAVSANSTTDFKEKDTNYKGYTCGAYGADAIYLGMENGQVKFMLAWSHWSGECIGSPDRGLQQFQKCQLLLCEERKSVP